MRIVWNAAKREMVLRDRSLDLARAGEVFDGFHLTRRDDRHSDEEERWTSVGLLDDAAVIVIWTVRDGDRRIVTMWKANERERDGYHRTRSRAG